MQTLPPFTGGKKCHAFVNFVDVSSDSFEALLEGMLQHGPNPDEISFNAVLKACGSQIPNALLN